MTDVARPQATGTLVLVRHGESTWIAENRFQGRQDPPLSELGRRQADLVAARLAKRTDQTPLPIPAGLPIAIWHSPLSRAADTARAIADAQPEQVGTYAVEELTEIAQGEWEGAPHAEVTTRWAAELAAWRRAPDTHHAPGGEPLTAASARVAAGLASITGRLAKGPASGEYDPVPGYQTYPPPTDRTEPWGVVVAHDGVFRLALLNLLDLPLRRFWAFPFNLCAITVVALHEGVPSFRAHNLSEHLAPLALEERAAAEARGDRRGAL